MYLCMHLCKSSSPGTIKIVTIAVRIWLYVKLLMISAPVICYLYHLLKTLDGVIYPAQI